MAASMILKRSSRDWQATKYCTATDWTQFAMTCEWPDGPRSFWYFSIHINIFEWISSSPHSHPVSKIERMSVSESSHETKVWLVWLVSVRKELILFLFRMVFTAFDPFNYSHFDMQRTDTHKRKQEYNSPADHVNNENGVENKWIILIKVKASPCSERDDR